MPANTVGKCLTIYNVEDTGADEIFKRTSVYLFGQFAGLVRIVLDLIVEDREIQGQAKADGVCGVHVFLAYCRCLLISLL